MPDEGGDSLVWSVATQTAVKAIVVLFAFLQIIQIAVAIHTSSQTKQLNDLDIHLRSQAARLNTIDERLRGQQAILNLLAERRARVELEDRLARALVVSCWLRGDAPDAGATALFHLAVTNRSARPLRVSRVSLRGWLGDAPRTPLDAGITWVNGPHEDEGTDAVRWRGVLSREFDSTLGHNAGVLELNEESHGDYPLRLDAPVGTWVLLKFELHATPIDREGDGGVATARACEIMCRIGEGANGCTGRHPAGEGGA